MQCDIWNQDCITGMRERLDPGSVDLTVTSIPFEELFSYSGKVEDVGNNGSTVDPRVGRFALNMRFFVDSLFAAHAPGTNACIHIQQLLAYKVQHGYMGRRDFRGAMIDVFSAGGFIFTGEFAIQKNPQALRNGSLVLTPRGWTPIESLVIGSEVIGSSGSTMVRGVHPQGVRPLFRVTTSDGASVDCDGQHLWTIRTDASINSPGPTSTVTTEWLSRHGLFTTSGIPRFFLPILSGPVEFQGQQLPMDPYLLGVLLGDGLLSGPRRVGVCTARWIVENIRLPLGHRVEKVAGTERGLDVATYAICGHEWHKNEVLDAIRNLGLAGCRAWEKFIPECYLFADKDSRRQLLAGLLDTDGGNKMKGGIKYHTTSERLAMDFRFLVESLGGLCTCSRKKGGTYHHNGKAKTGRDIWELTPRLRDGECPFRLPRKVATWKEPKRRMHRAIVSIRPVGEHPCTCITVAAADGLFVTEGCVLTHNSIANRLNLHSLQFKTGYARDGNALAPCPNDYVLIFQKPGQCQNPVKPIFERTKNPRGWVTTEEWIRDAHGIWTDIMEIDVLDGARSKGHKESEHERHVCPLQLAVISRLVRLYSNPVSIQPDVLVLDPFMGIGSTAWVCLGAPSPVTKFAIEEPRNVAGFELKESYHRAALANVAKAKRARAAKEKEEEGLYRLVESQ